MAMPPVWALPLISVGGSMLKRLIAGESADDAMDAIQGGFDSANRTIQAGADKAWQHLDPYLKGGREDYDRYRALSNSGYYDTPYSGSVQPQAFNNQAVNPSQFNPGTQSYESSYQPMQFRPMGLLSSPSLPMPPSMAAPEPPPMVPMTRPNATPMPQVGPTPEGMRRGMDQVRSNTLGLDASLPNKHETPNPYADAVLPPGARNPTQPLTLAERIAIYRQGGRGSGPYMPYDFQNPFYGGGLVGRNW